MDHFAGTLDRRTVKYNDSNIAYWSNGSGKPTLVFVHGWTCASALWRRQGHLFQKYNCILVDLPGHGSSDAPDTEYNLEHFARATGAVLDAERTPRAVLIGFSLGGPVSTMVMRLFPNLVAGVIYVDSFFQLPDHYLTSVERVALAAKIDQDAVFRQIIETFFSAKTDVEARELVLSTMLATPKHVRLRATTSNYTPHAWRDDEVYDVPALNIVTPRFSKHDSEWERHVPRLRKQVWNGNGHFLFMEEPARFAGAVETFLKEERLDDGFQRDVKISQHNL